MAPGVRPKGPGISWVKSLIREGSRILQAGTQEGLPIANVLGGISDPPARELSLDSVGRRMIWGAIDKGFESGDVE